MDDDSGYLTSFRGMTSGSEDENRQSSDQDQGLVMREPRTSVSEKEVIDLLKVSYLLKATKLCHGELSLVPPSTHQVWSELKASLSASPALANCSSESQKSITRAHLEGSNGTTRTKRKPSREPCEVGNRLQSDLLDLVREELLQSIVPYLLDTKILSSGKFDYQDSLQVNSNRGFLHPLRRKSISENNLHQLMSNNRTMSSQEITIHVCDDSRDAKRDFTCPQDVLMTHMGYFNDLTSGQNLEEVDISVHCDITIFEWLMAWIQAQTSKADRPQLEPSTVMSILVSGSFLKMDQLVDEALQYVHRNMNKVLAVTFNMNCLSDSMLQRLASFYSPSQVEDILDRRDRIQSKLFVKLILSLCEPVAQPEREIYQSAGTLHRCRLCGLFLTEHLAQRLPCLPLRSSINLRGNIVPKHQWDPHFNANDLLRGLRSELKSWRRVFWRLWGMVHTLQCSLCSNHFPLYLNEFCTYHTHDPEFPAIPFKNSTHPFGLYPCCQTSIHRFQPMPPAPNGCQSREHKVKLKSEGDKAIFKLLMTHRDSMCLSAMGRTKIKIPSDINSVCVPKPLSSLSPVTVFVGDENPNEFSLVPKFKIRCLLNRTVWQVKKPTPPPAKALIKKSVSSLSLNSNSSTAKSAAQRWKTITYGRLKRVPKMPVRQEPRDSSSSSDDMSEESSGLDEEENGLEFDMEQKNDLCIEIKIAQEVNEDKNGGVNDNRSLDKRSGLSISGSNSNFLSVNRPGSGRGSRANSRQGSPRRSKEKSDVDHWMKWDCDQSTRANQDNQREMECTALDDIIKHLDKSQDCGGRHNKPTVFGGSMGTPMTNRTWTNLQMVQMGGTYLKLEQDWRETHMAYLQHKSIRVVSTPATNLRPTGSRDFRPHSAATFRTSRITTRSQR